LNDEATKADIGRRSLLLAGTALPVLSVASCGLQLQQAQGQPSSGQSTPATAGNAVAVAPSDTIAAIQAKLNSVPPGGTLEFPANSAFNFNGQTVRGKSGITVLANGPVTINGAPGPGTAGAFDFGGMSSWTLRGRAPSQGFVFNNTLVNADGSKQGAVGHCMFNNVASNGLNGSTIRMTDASFLLVINNDFNNCGGNVLGCFNWDNVTIDGNHFTNCWQPISLGQSNDTSRGRNITLVRNVLVGEIYSGFEMTGDGEGVNGYLSNLLIDNNWVRDITGTQGTMGNTGPVSIVVRGQYRTKVTNNFFRLGSLSVPHTEAIELNSSAEQPEVTGNLIEDFSNGITLYGVGAKVHGNRLFNTGGATPNDTMLTTRPTDPPQPVRIAW